MACGRHSPNVLLLFFDDLTTDLARSVRRVSDFLAVDLTDAELRVVVDQSRHAFMTRADVVTRFNDLPPKLARAMRIKMGIAEDDRTSQITTVQPHRAQAGSEVLPEYIKRELDRLWTEIVLPRTGCSNLHDMRAQFAAERESLAAYRSIMIARKP